MDTDQLKKKLRALKKVEKKIRYEYNTAGMNMDYVWNRFFSTKSINDLTVKYPLWKLVQLDKYELKKVFEDYFYCVYYEKFRENGLKFDDMYDPNLLSFLGLHQDASFDEIKAKFRELAKKYHPDHGGDKDKMIELIDVYKKLMSDD
jgi:DnaJ-like protein